ncbi:MAG: hypothetical protein QOK40_2297 [Miltoncostaeaceae bacterium]|nr:hypothetical protein [Miltoncostaeaceae bacterium]
MLWSGRWLIVATALAAAAVGLILTFARPTEYTSTARVALGQPTTSSGVPVQTFTTNPSTAAGVLTGDDIVAAVARRAGVSEKRIRDNVSFSIPRSPGASAGNQPAVAEISFTDGNSRTAQRVVDAYADAVLAKVSAPYAEVLRVSVARRDADRARQQQLLAQLQEYAKQLPGAGASDRITLQSLLFSAQSQLQTVQLDLADAELIVAKALQIEQPQIIAKSNGATSSSSVGKRGRTVVLAAIIGLLLGIVVTFVWRGSPAGRAAKD